MCGRLRRKERFYNRPGMRFVPSHKPTVFRSPASDDRLRGCTTNSFSNQGTQLVQLEAFKLYGPISYGHVRIDLGLPERPRPFLTGPEKAGDLFEVLNDPLPCFLLFFAAESGIGIPK